MFPGLRSFRTTKIGKLCHIVYIDDHFVKYMILNFKKILLLFGFGVVFLKINVLRHLWREIALR